MKKLAMFAGSQPHVAYSAFSQGILSRWMYFTWGTIAVTIRQTLIPAITGRRTICTFCPRRWYGNTHSTPDILSKICNPLVEACGEATEGNLMQEHAKNTQHLVE